MKVLTKEMLHSHRGSTSWFTGEVWLDEVVSGGSPTRLRATRVTFAPGARTSWHTHPLGQALHVLSGTGWVQLKGKLAQPIGAGDSVWVEAGELHWHGAASTHTLVHLAIQEVDEHGTDVDWLDQVMDAEYALAGSR